MASTKAFLAQITAAYLLGLYLQCLRGNKVLGRIASIPPRCRTARKDQKVIDNYQRRSRNWASK